MLNREDLIKAEMEAKKKVNEWWAEFEREFNQPITDPEVLAYLANPSVNGQSIGETFTFDCDAPKVLTMFVGDGINTLQRPYGLQQGELRLTGHIDGAPGNLYSVAIGARIIDEGPPEMIGHIAIRQTKPGKCQAILYLTDDTRTRATSAFAFGKDIINKVWRQKIDEYLRGAISVGEMVKTHSLKFTIESNPAAFANWLKANAGVGVSVDTDRGPLHLREFIRIGDCVSIEGIRGPGIVRPADRRLLWIPDLDNYETISSVIAFDMVDLGNRYLQIRAECKAISDRLVIYFCQLLIKIAKTRGWQDAAEAIGPFVAALAGGANGGQSSSRDYKFENEIRNMWDTEPRRHPAPLDSYKTTLQFLKSAKVECVVSQTTDEGAEYTLRAGDTEATLSFVKVGKETDITLTPHPASRRIPAGEDEEALIEFVAAVIQRTEERYKAASGADGRQMFISQNVDWQCSKCSARFAGDNKLAGLAHIRIEHGAGTLHPRLNLEGHSALSKFIPQVFPEIGPQTEPEILSDLGLKAETVEPPASGAEDGRGEQPAPAVGNGGDGLPKKPAVKREEVSEEDYRAAWCQYKYDCDKAGIRFLHADLAKAIGLQEGSARNYYNDVWKPKNTPS